MSQTPKFIEIAIPIVFGIFCYGILLGALILFRNVELLPLSFAESLSRFLLVPVIGLVFAFIESLLIFLLCLVPGGMFILVLGYIKPGPWALNASIAAFVAFLMHAYFVSVPRLSSHPDTLSVALFAMEALLLFTCFLASANIGSTVNKRLTRRSTRTHATTARAG